MIVRILSSVLLAWILGFAWFAILLPQPLGDQKTDAVVVPTGGPLRIDILGCGLGPQQAGFQGGLLGPQVLGYAKAALSDASILGGIGLLYIVFQGNVEAVALTCQFRDQQRQQGFLAEVAVNLRLRFGGDNSRIFHRWRAIRGRGSKGLTAT